MNYSTFDQLKATLSTAIQHEPLGPCCANPRHEAERREGFEYLSAVRAKSGNALSALLLATSCRAEADVSTFSGRECAQFSWHGTLLGEFSTKELALGKGVRFEPYERMFPLACNSATLSPPLPEAVQAADGVATVLRFHAMYHDTRALEQTVANVSRTAFEHLCQRYRVDTHTSEVLFDDNATMALFQYLGMLQPVANPRAMTFFDTGRVMPHALSGQNPEFLPHNFHPAMDVWGNRTRLEGRADNLPQGICSMIEHYTDGYLSDSKILADALSILEKERPNIIVVPTVTRAGRRLAFIEFCEALRAKAEAINHNPLIILDDAQGLGRMTPERYFKKKNGETVNLWSYTDGVLLTGAKVTGALMGSGAILFNKQSFMTRQLPFEAHPLIYRARQYAFVSDDRERMRSHNTVAPGIAQSPEIASLTVALESLPKPEEVYNVMRQMRQFVVDRLKRIPGIRVLAPDPNSEARFEDSIITFYLADTPLTVSRFRQLLAEPRQTGRPEWDDLPITLPAIISADQRQYLRIALDPRRASSKTDPYLLKIDYILGVIDTIMRSEQSK